MYEEVSTLGVTGDVLIASLQPTTATNLPILLGHRQARRNLLGYTELMGPSPSTLLI